MNGALLGFLGFALAAGGGGLLWRRLRKNRRPKTTRLDPITVRLAPLAQHAHLALPPAADLPPGQGQAWPQEQAPWEQATLVDLRWTPGQPSAEHPFADQGGYPFPDQGDYPFAGQGGYPFADQGGYPFPDQGGYPIAGQGGYPIADQGGYPFPDQGEHPYSQDPEQHPSQLRTQAMPPAENPFLDQDQDQVQRPPWTPGSPPPAPPAPGQRAAQHPDQAQHPHPDAF